MTKKTSMQREATKVAPKKRRKLTKAEEEEYTREMNRIWGKISEGIQKGEIDMTGWKRNP